VAAGGSRSRPCLVVYRTFQAQGPAGPDSRGSMVARPGAARGRAPVPARVGYDRLHREPVLPAPILGKTSPLSGSPSPILGRTSPKRGARSPKRDAGPPIWGDASPILGESSPKLGTSSPKLGKPSPIPGNPPPKLGHASPKLTSRDTPAAVLPTLPRGAYDAQDVVRPADRRLGDAHPPLRGGGERASGARRGPYGARRGSRRSQKEPQRAPEAPQPDAGRSQTAARGHCPRRGGGEAPSGAVRSPPHLSRLPPPPPSS
jgi:hypothetical protein